MLNEDDLLIVHADEDSDRHLRREGDDDEKMWMDSNLSVKEYSDGLQAATLVAGRIAVSIRKRRRFPEHPGHVT